MKIFENISSNSYIFVAPIERVRLLRLILFIIFTIFFVRLFQLQVLSGDKFKIYSEAQAIKKLRLMPPRGQIYDRNNKLLVHNQASYNLNIIPASFDSTSQKILSNLIEIDPLLLQKAKFLKKKFERYTPFTILRDLDFETLSLIKEYQHFLNGVSIEIVTKRLYSDSVKMSHILGYIREASEKQIQQRPYLKAGDKIGQDGIEKFYDELLRGVDGYEIVAFNREGKRVDEISQEFESQEAIAGANLFLSIDFDLQYYVEKLLDGKRGASIGIDPRNGEILFLVSKPDFDPDIFSGKLTHEDARFLFQDESKPLYNRVIQGTYPPGSTWKMLMAIAGLEEGVITPTSTYVCTNGYHYGDRTIKCHGVHGAISIVTAIQVSCNPYFSNLASKLGIDLFSKWGYLFGFGKLTGIDLPAENIGLFPSIQWFNQQFHKEVNYQSWLPNFGIGQGEISVTPIQLAQYVSAIANRGVMHQPHLVRKLENISVRKIENNSYSTIKLPVDDWVFDYIHKGMYKVVNEGGGTATNAQISGIKVCGKTGTAQNTQGRDHSWFVAFAPMDNPEIVIVTIVENAGFGATVAAPITRDILMKHFKVAPAYTSKPDSADVNAD